MTAEAGPERPPEREAGPERPPEREAGPERPPERTTLSAVIACYRDAPAVPVMHERLSEVFQGLGVDYEIIFVNDGSPDNAREVLADLASRDARVTVVNHSRAFGSQSAFTSGMDIATGDAVILLDGDLQDPPEVIPALVEKWREGFEVVYGERVQREATLPMRVGYKLFYRVLRRFSYVPVPLDAGDFSLLDRRVVDNLKRLPEKHRFIRGLRAWIGFRQAGVPYVRPERMFGTTTNSMIKNLGWARRGLISLSYAPINFIAWLALVTMGVSVLAIVVQVAVKLAYPGAVPKGITTVLLVVLFLGAMQFLCLSIIGSYLAHVYEEVKGRPAYVVDEILNPPRPVTAPPGAAPPAAAPSLAAPLSVAPTIRTSTPAADGTKRVLVTGAAGFVGANLVRRLVADGHAVTAVVGPNSLRWRLAGLGSSIDVVELDLRDTEGIRASVRRAEPEWVFHLAAHGAYSWQTDLDRIMTTNFLATVQLVDACRSAGCEAFVHAGSSSEYGFKDRPPSEADAVEPNSDYAVAKAAATSYCQLAARTHGLRAVTLRLYSVYGPYEDPRRLMPSLIGRGLRNELPPLVGPDVAHDFVEVDDVVDAFLGATAAEPGSVYNVGTGTQTSLADVVDVARRVLDIEPAPVWESATPRPWDTHSWVADSRKIRRDLGWRPSSDLEAGFRHMVEWLTSTPEVWSMYGITLDDVAAHEARVGDRSRTTLGHPRGS